MNHKEQLIGKIPSFGLEEWASHEMLEALWVKYLENGS